jgi:hypothetical protein
MTGLNLSIAVNAVFTAKSGIYFFPSNNLQLLFLLAIKQDSKSFLFLNMGHDLGFFEQS